MGLTVADPNATVLHASITVPSSTPISLITDEGEQVTDNGVPVFLFDANGDDEIVSTVVASPIVIWPGTVVNAGSES